MSKFAFHNASDQVHAPTVYDGGGHALINHLSASDWRNAVSKLDQGAAATHELKITDLEKDKSTLVDANASEDDKAKAIRELYDSGVREVHIKDKDGVEHTYDLEEKKSKWGNEISATDEKGQTIFEAVVDENGNIIYVPRAAGGDSSGGRSGGGGGGGGGGGERHSGVSRRRPSGMNYSGGEQGGVGHYHEPSGGQNYNPTGNYDHHTWQGVKNTDGSVAIKFKGCQVDTDGSGAFRHTEDKYRQNQTSLKRSDHTSLDTDRDNFFVLPPSVAKAYGIKKGDLGWLVQESTGKAVPVVLGDFGPEGKLGEASVAALKSLGYNNVNGRNGVSGDGFKIVFVPGSGNGTGDIARDPKAMADKLNQSGTASSSTQVA
jgi:hypothetical protein